MQHRWRAGRTARKRLPVGRSSLCVLGAFAVGVGLVLVPWAGCTKTATVEGKPIAADRVAGIVPGETTEAELREWFGPPADEVTTHTGKVLTYRYSKGSGSFLSLPFLGIGAGTATGQLLIVTLDQNGKVVRHTFVGSP